MKRTSIKEIRQFLIINGMEIEEEAVQAIEEIVNTSTHLELNERNLLEWLIGVAQNCKRDTITSEDLNMAFSVKFPNVTLDTMQRIIIINGKDDYPTILDY